ncbi:hypothetical protein H9L21_06440 [Aeromicrobium senzhongii]|uniref:Uncharacterized protein n=1 Tax=Aeromicrobium senzhongii TaxID=2663859 RepID=A0ABX6SY77_9ACTN|nr:hypothetical protein [Aeromicrobium senzhongii]MTB87395.1 hypothetical protein [Aeromicrobium senzhongii]QNL95547.1 hypothetical protein H9L21_06440 [Aeromicrobium senzhongii]
MSPKGFLGGLSWLQLVAGALAAMTSAWVASFLGVAGTIIGAALGSLVASIASALYARGIDRGTTLITESGSVVSRTRPAAAESDRDAEDGDVVITQEQTVVTVDEAERAFPWKRVLTWTGLALAVSLLAIGAFELVTGDSFGKADNPTIGRPWKDQGSSPETPSDGETTRPTESAKPTEEPTDGATNDPPATTRPEPTAPAPTTEAPEDTAPEPQRDATPPPAEQAPQVVPE